MAERLHHELGTVFLVEDSVERSLELLGQIARLDRRSGGPLTLADPRVVPPRAALDLARGSKLRPIWGPDDLLLLDCMDRDAPFEPGHGATSSLFAIDILLAFDAARQAGLPTPRVLAHSSGMDDAMLRATLGEFLWPRTRLTLPGEDPPTRYRIEPGTTGVDDTVLWAMFDRTTLQEHLAEILSGDRSWALDPPGPESPVWAEILPTSCLASFHSALRDAYPTVWRDHVVRSLPWTGRRQAVRRGILRLGRTYLAANPERGTITYRGYVEIARAITNPGGI